MKWPGTGDCWTLSQLSAHSLGLRTNLSSSQPSHFLARLPIACSMIGSTVGSGCFLCTEILPEVVVNTTPEPPLSAAVHPASTIACANCCQRTLADVTPFAENIFAKTLRLSCLTGIGVSSGATWSDVLGLAELCPGKSVEVVSGANRSALALVFFRRTGA